jgi:hypothetical protein
MNPINRSTKTWTPRKDSPEVRWNQNSGAEEIRGLSHRVLQGLAVRSQVLSKSLAMRSNLRNEEKPRESDYSLLNGRILIWF